MSKAAITKRKEQLEEMERKAKKKLQSGTDSVEQNVSRALKTGLIIGGVLFAGYQVARLFTSSSRTEDLKKKALTSQ
jgi:hypothetical protein